MAVREGFYTGGYLGLAPVLTASLAQHVACFEERPFAAALTGVRGLAATMSIIL